MFVLKYISKYMYIVVLTEAKYGKNRQKKEQKNLKFIFLKMQEDYRPDGWLGLILGEKKYISVTNKAHFNESMKELETALSDHQDNIDGHGLHLETGQQMRHIKKVNPSP